MSINWETLLDDQRLVTDARCASLRAGGPYNLRPDGLPNVKVQTQSVKIFRKLGQWGPEILGRVTKKILTQVKIGQTETVFDEDGRSTNTVTVIKDVHGVTIVQIN